jgi:far upstream element-binding protein
VRGLRAGKVVGMAHDGGEALAPEDYEAPRIENKRKFDETGGDELPVGNFNGNSDGGEAGVPAAAVASYNNVPPPLSEFELAKQKAAQIAARLVGAEVKRPRTEEAAEDHSVPVRTNGLDLGAAFAGECLWKGALGQTRVVVS